jgi:hypothetical protein
MLSIKKLRQIELDQNKKASGDQSGAFIF